MAMWYIGGCLVVSNICVFYGIFLFLVLTLYNVRYNVSVNIFDQVDNPKNKNYEKNFFVDCYVLHPPCDELLRQGKRKR